MFKPSQCSLCPIADTSVGFCLDTGNVETATMLIVLEAPGTDEIAFRLSDQPEPYWSDEIIRRSQMYAIDPKFMRTGANVVGRAGQLLWNWILAPCGIRREDVCVANTLRCVPKKVNDSPYPTGDDRKGAESACRQYDHIIRAFRPDTCVVTLHPSALLRDITPLPLVLTDVRKARDFALQGRRVMLCMGGKAARVFTGGNESTVYWRGNYCEFNYDEMFAELV